MKLRSSSVFVALIATLYSLVAVAQNPAGPLPADPRELMTLAHEKNGLTGDNIQPWHMRGTYHSYKDGKVDYEGTYEEWWFGPAKYKLSFTSPKFTQTDYATGHELLREGAQEWLSGPELLLRSSLVDPLPDPSQLKEFALQAQEQHAGKGKLECVSLTFPVRPNLAVKGDFYPAACFESALPILRVFGSGSSRVIYNRLVTFQGQYLAKQIEVVVNGKPIADLNIEQIEGLQQGPDSVIAPPSTAVVVDLSAITFKASITQWPLKKAVPVYPEEAKSRRMEGRVTLHATIAGDGHLQALQPIDGPTPLQPAALDAVRQWVYRPVKIMGEPRRVEIEIKVIFSLG